MLSPCSPTSPTRSGDGGSSDLALKLRSHTTPARQDAVEDHVGEVVTARGVKDARACDELERGVRMACVDVAAGKIALGVRARPDHRVLAVHAVGQTHHDALARASSPKRKKTAGPDLESTWPRITADPGSPGVGPPRNQPGTSASLGACIEPSALRPSELNPAEIPRLAISKKTGCDHEGKSRSAHHERFRRGARRRPRR